MRILSLGAGVQSSTMALMIAKGEIPMVDAAVFADTNWEPKAVYAWLDWLETQLPFPIYRVSRGDLRADTLARSNSGGKRVAAVPWHMVKPNGERGMGMRQCTHEYKITPLQRKARELAGYEPRKRIPKNTVEMLIGISTDEAMRMKPSRVAWIKNTYPLIDMDVSRQGCLRWMEKNYPGYTPPKSSCLGCPFHSDAEWRRVGADPEEWADTVMIDKAIRNQPGFKGQQFMHKSCKPLDEVDLSTAEERGQLNFFNNECEGMCGV